MKRKSYRLGLFFRYNIWEIEAEIEKLLGTSHASGAGFGERDLGYYFNNKNSLYSAVKKVRRLPRKIRCEAYEMIDSYGDGKKVSLKGIK